MYVFFHRKLINFGTNQFGKGPLLADWGSQRPLIFRASGNPAQFLNFRIPSHWQ